MTTYHYYPTPAPSLSPTLAPYLDRSRAINGSSVGEDGSGSSLTVLDCGAQCVVGTWLAGLGVFIFGVPSLWMICVAMVPTPHIQVREEYERGGCSESGF